MLRNWFSRFVATIAVLGLAASATLAADKTAKSAADDREQVELFSAMESGDLEVTFVAKNSKGATVVIKNNTKKPLAVKLPEAFAGVPVLAQFGQGGGGFGGGGLGGGGLGGGGQTQGLGGGFGGQGGGGFGGQGGGGGGLGGGIFNVEAEKAGKVKVDCVCLEHGKKDPSPHVKYKIVPLESVSSDPNLAEVCKMLGRKEIDQTSAQVATWHIANKMSFEELAAKTVRHANGVISSYFDLRNIEAGMKVVQVAAARAEELKKSQPATSGKSSSEPVSTSTK